MKRFIYPCLILFAACSQPKQSGLIYYNDCESIKGWGAVYLSTEKAHSGIYSNKLDSAHIFGLTFRQTVPQISAKKIKTVKVSAWVYISPMTKGGMVLEVRNHDEKIIFWDSKRTDATDVVPNKWEFISKDFSINDSINKPENTIAVYPWCSGKSEFYVDDVRVEFVTAD